MGLFDSVDVFACLVFVCFTGALWLGFVGSSWVVVLYLVPLVCICLIFGLLFWYVFAVLKLCWTLLYGVWIWVLAV